MAFECYFKVSLTIVKVNLNVRYDNKVAHHHLFELF